MGLFWSKKKQRPQQEEQYERKKSSVVVVPRPKPVRHRRDGIPPLLQLCLEAISDNMSFFGDHLLYLPPELRDSLLSILDYENRLSAEVLGALFDESTTVLGLANIANVTDEQLLFLVKKSASLLELDTSYCSQLSSACMETVFPLTTALTSLKLSMCGQLSEVALSGISLFPHLQTLDLSFCVAVDSELLLNITDSCKQITALTLAGCRDLTSAGLEKALRNLATLTSLNIAETNTQRLYCGQHPQLVSLDISSTEVKEIHAPQLTRLVARCCPVTVIDLPNLRVLHLKERSVWSLVAKGLPEWHACIEEIRFDMMRDNGGMRFFLDYPMLHTLHVSRFSGDGHEQLLEASHTLTSLDATGMSFSPKEISALFPNLRELYLPAVTVRGGIRLKLPQLVKLDARLQQVWFNDLELESVVQHSPSLTWLDVSGCYVSEVALVMAAQKLPLRTVRRLLSRVPLLELRPLVKHVVI